ncbi:PQQ-binding-like beta-propeller repeat protein [Streptomyces lavendulocolor]|uniref:outer membrane protein assembly factor BamB family protein n=1 Tax=Streptomyces lavendulocolor TaxID=67316 RepID=UPI003C2ADEFA
MRTTTARKATHFLLAVATAALALSACDSRSDSPPADEKERAQQSFEIDQKPAWTAPAAGKRYCPEYFENAIIDGGAADITVRDAATGKTRWSHKGVVTCPLVTKEAVYVGKLEGEALSLDPLTGKTKRSLDVAAFDPDGINPVETGAGVHFEFGGDLYTVDKSLGQEVWSYEEEADMWIEQISSHALTVVLATQNGKVKALSAADGKLLWTYATPSHAVIDGGITITDDAVYFGSRDGSAYALDLATGKQLWSKKLGGHGATWTPEVSANLVITADAEYIHGLDKKTGKTKWRHYAPDHGSVRAAAGQVFYADPEADEVTVLNAATGDFMTSVSPAPGAYRLAVGPTHLYVWTTSSIQAHKITKRASA